MVQCSFLVVHATITPVRVGEWLAGRSVLSALLALVVLHVAHLPP